jgi:hypothetical protein
VANEEDLKERIGKVDERIGELEKRQRSRFATWAPVLVSVLAALVSVTSLFSSTYRKD